MNDKISIFKVLAHAVVHIQIGVSAQHFCLEISMSKTHYLSLGLVLGVLESRWKDLGSRE